ncbi:MAG: class I SAM-dependent methyltransferase [Pseudomonadota bacterium]|nr:class I SAM-dependent methyltransferase [Pseudomonadota bacterium]
MNNKEHWEQVYENRSWDSVSWFQEHSERSLNLIRRYAPGPDAHIMDIGGGASTLVDDLLLSGYRHLSVLDISAAALRVAQQRLQDRAARVNWLAQDITRFHPPRHSIDIWHDRAVFHFLNDAADRHAYVRTVLNAVKPGGHVIMSTFATDGPEKCSGLSVCRYDAGSLHQEFGTPFRLLGHEHETHLTPNGSPQHFLYCYCRVNNG